MDRVERTRSDSSVKITPVPHLSDEAAHWQPHTYTHTQTLMHTHSHPRHTFLYIMEMCRKYQLIEI